MLFTPQRFVHIGFGNVQCANRIEVVLIPGSASAKRLTKAAKEQKLFLDLTSGRTTKALILLDDGKQIGCALSPRTIASRIQSITADENNEGDCDHEDHSPSGQDSKTH